MTQPSDQRTPIDARPVDADVRRSLVLRLRDLSHVCDPYTGDAIEELADEIDTLIRGTISRCEQNHGYVGFDGQWIKKLKLDHVWKQDVFLAFVATAKRLA